MAIHFFQGKKQEEDPNLPEKVLDAAHARAEKIIERALRKSEEILQDMDTFREEMKKELRPIFKQSAESFVKTVKDESAYFIEACTVLIPEIKERYLKGMEQTLEKFKTDLTKETTDLLKTKIDAEWQQAQKDIEEYKEKQKQQIEKQIEEKISALVREAFGKSLTVSQHQQLVMNALEKAREEGVFNSK